MKQDYLDIARQVLDRQLIDSNNVPCGKVDDLEIEVEGEAMKVKAILVGRGVRARRLPALLRLIAEKTAGGKAVRVPWEQVEVITSQIKLKSRADELGLNKTEREAAVWVSKLPLS